MYKTKSLVQKFSSTSFLKFYIQFYLILFLSLPEQCMLVRQNVNNDVTKDSPINSINLKCKRIYCINCLQEGQLFLELETLATG